MAKVQITSYQLTDDLDGSDLGKVEAGANPFTREFTAFGVDYTIDLSDSNNDALQTALAQAANNMVAAQKQADEVLSKAREIAAELMSKFVESATEIVVEAPPAPKAARKAAKPAQSQGSAAQEKELRQMIRRWAMSHVVDFPAQGRMPEAVTDAYNLGSQEARIKALTDWAHQNQKAMRGNGAPVRQAAPVAMFSAPVQSAPVSAPPASSAPEVVAQAAPVAAKRTAKK